MTAVEQTITDQVTALRLIQSDRATYEKAVHAAALRTRDENDLIVAQELGGYLGHAVNVDTLHELGQHLHTVAYDLWEDPADRHWHEIQIESLTSAVLAGPAVGR